MSFDASAIGNLVGYFPYDLNEGWIRKQCEDAMRVPIGINTFYTAPLFLSDCKEECHRKENIYEAEVGSSYRSSKVKMTFGAVGWFLTMGSGLVLNN
jgi:hypothetical protein